MQLGDERRPGELAAAESAERAGQLVRAVEGLSEAAGIRGTLGRAETQTPCVWVREKEVEVTAFLFSDLLILANRFDSELNLRVFFKTELCAPGAAR